MLQQSQIVLQACISPLIKNIVHLVLQPTNGGDDSEHNVEFAGGNVQLVTTKESWEQKMAEAKRDGKIVSSQLNFFFFALFLKRYK